MLKAYSRIVLILSWLMLVFCLRLAVWPVALMSKPREARLRRRVFRLFGQGALRIVRMRVTVEGPVPQPPYLLVANHLAGFDIFVIASILGPIFISQDDVASWPVVGFITRSVNTIFIDRSRVKEVARVNEIVRRRLDEGEGIAFFPESTTSPDGNLLPFKSALFEPAVQLHQPMHYAAISYRTPEGAPSALESCVWRDPDNVLEHFRKVSALPRSEAIVVFGSDTRTGEDRKELADDLRDAVAAIQKPLD